MPYKNIEDARRNSRLRQRQDKYKKYRRDYYLAHPSYFRDKQRGYYNQVRSEIIRLLGGKCINCGFYSDPRALTIDHVRGNGSEERRLLIKSKSNGLKYYRFILKRIQEGSKDYQCLCANCNLIKKIEKDEYRRKAE